MDEISQRGVYQLSRRIYISADFAPNNGDRDVVDEIHRWCIDPRRRLDFYDTANPSCGSISADPDCRPCDLKKEFNQQINASSAVIFVVGDKTASRTAGSLCRRNTEGAWCVCTPYKQNANGSTICKCVATSATSPDDDIGEINQFSYLEHEFKQAIRRNKRIVIVYNSLYCQPSWLPTYMGDCEPHAHPFWTRDNRGNRVGNYQLIMKALGYD